MSDDDTTLCAEHGQTARHGFVISKPTIAMQLNPICKAPFDIIQREWPLRMSRDLHALPGSEIAVNLAPGFANFLLNCLNGRIKIDIMLVGVIL